MQKFIKIITDYSVGALEEQTNYFLMKLGNKPSKVGNVKHLTGTGYAIRITYRSNEKIH